jgi:outer membrane protein assembly factor BamE (lipoprotein component of BamABCDE complex)
VSAIVVNQRRQDALDRGYARVPTAPDPNLFLTLVRHGRQGLLVVALLTLLGGCSMMGPFRAPETLRGNHVDDYRLKELVPGTSTQADATALIGSPTAKATFDSNTWLYISEFTQTRIGRTPGVADQTVIALVFDDRGVLRDIKRVDQADALPVTVVARETPSPGTSASFMQQLFGNIGRFNPIGPAAGGQTGGGGAPAPGSL